MNTSANLVVGNTIQTLTAKVLLQILILQGRANVGEIADTEGEFFGSDGKISEDVMRYKIVIIIKIIHM